MRGKAALEAYQTKRNFTSTPEPKGEIRDSEERRFVVQEHHASHLHYDFRLEMNGVLRSWAVPKEPSQRVGLRRLAVQVEDHPIDYIDFEGIIPEGQYGAGTVHIWDRGTYNLEKARSNELRFMLHGKKLHGRYILVRMENHPRDWLLIKLKEC
jgi:bifunctional non-homologous end joining protein LigD